MSSTGGLVSAILNDYVPKKTRGRWNILDSFKRGAWSGSSVLGGVLVDRIGYEDTFLVTASMQFSATLLLVPLGWMIASEGGNAIADNKGDSARLTPNHVSEESDLKGLPCEQAVGSPEPEDAYLSKLLTNR